VFVSPGVTFFIVFLPFSEKRLLSLTNGPFYLVLYHNFFSQDGRQSTDRACWSRLFKTDSYMFLSLQRFLKLMPTMSVAEIVVTLGAFFRRQRSEIASDYEIL